jgi:ubiquinone biosynthesis protein
MRLARAYTTTVRVLAGYLWLRMWRPVLGPGLYAARLSSLHARNARRVEEAILALGGLFIKVGQLISILTNFLPEEFRRELEGLQDQVPPRPYSQVVERLRTEFGRAPDELFAHIDPVPVATASLAQVHVATLHDGRKVAVKAQHPDIEVLAKQDLDAIRNILALVQMITRVRGLESYHAEISQMIAEELDFTSEANNIETIGGHFLDAAAVRVPSVVRELSSRRVLTTEFIEGTKVTNFAELAVRGIDRGELARRILTAYCQMIFVDGMYHADPHPGNLFVGADGAVVFVDFGAVGVLSRDMKEGIPAFLEGVIRRDTQRVTTAMRRMGFIAREAGDGRDPKTDVATRVIEYFQQRFLDQITIDSWKLSDIQVDMRTKLDAMADLRKLDVSFRQLTATFQVPKDWVLLERTLLLLLGLCTELDPAMNPVTVIQPYLEKEVLGDRRDWMQLVRTSVKEMTMAALTIPEGMQRLLSSANRGELEVRVPEIRSAARLVYAAAHQLMFGVMAVALGVVAFFADDRGRTVMARWTAGGAALCILALLMSMWSAREDR